MKLLCPVCQNVAGELEEVTERGTPCAKCAFCFQKVDGIVRAIAPERRPFYDRFLASSGLRTTQFSILIRLRLAGPMSINALAKGLVMDRTTLGRNILPLERDGLIEIVPDPADGRSKVVRLTEAGAARLRAARAGWTQAQKEFEAAFGGTRAARLRDLLQAVTATELAAAAGG